MVDHGLSAASNLLVLFAVAASKSTASIASFSLVFGFAAFAGGAYRMLILEPLLSDADQENDVLHGSVLRVALLVAVCLGLVLAPVALLAGSELWLILAFGFPTLLAADTVRYLGFASKQMRTPLLIDAVWFVGAALLFVFRDALSVSMLLATWIAAAGIGLVVFGWSTLVKLTNSPADPFAILGIDNHRIGRVVEQGWSYLIGFVASAGLMTALLFLLALRATDLDVATFRMAVAIGGLANLMTAALYAVLIPKVMADPQRGVPTEVYGLLAGCCVAAAAAIVVVPDAVGSYAFGETWQQVKGLRWLIVGFMVLKFVEVPWVAKLRADSAAKAVMHGRLAASAVLVAGLVLGFVFPITATSAFVILVISLGASLVYWAWVGHEPGAHRMSIAQPLTILSFALTGASVIFVSDLWLLLAAATLVVALKVRNLPELMKSSADTAAVVMASLGILGVALYPFYKNGGAIMSSFDRLTVGERTHTLLVFLAAAAALLAGGRLAKRTKFETAETTSSEAVLGNLSRFVPILIFGSAVTTVLFAVGFGFGQLLDRNSYIPESYMIKELMAGLSLLLVPCMGALAVSRELSRRSASRALAGAVALVLFVLAFATGGRELAAMPPAFFLAGFAIRTAQGKQPKRLARKVGVLALVSLLLYPVPVALRQLDDHGLFAYTESLFDGTMTAELGEPDFLVGTVMFSIPMLTITEEAETNYWAGDLGAAANPLPGKYSSWGERERRLQYIRFSDTAGVPLSTLGTISAGGWLVLVGMFFLFGLLLEDSATRASRRYGPIVAAVSMPIGGLFSILAAQYTARQVARYVTLLILLNLWCRRPSTTVSHPHIDLSGDDRALDAAMDNPNSEKVPERNYV